MKRGSLSSTFKNYSLLTLFLLALILSGWYVGFDFVKLWEGLPRLSGFLKGFLHPDLSQRFLRLVLTKSFETLVIAFFGTVVGALLCFPLAFLASSNLMETSAGKSIVILVRGVFGLARSLDALIVAIVVSIAVGIGPFAGSLAVAFHTFGVLGKLFYELFEEAQEEIYLSILSTGAPKFLAIRYGLLPTVFPQMLSLTLYRLDTNIRMSTVLGLVGGGGIGFLLTQYIKLYQFSKTSTVLLAILVLVMLSDFASYALRKRVKN